MAVYEEASPPATCPPMEEAECILAHWTDQLVANETSAREQELEDGKCLGARGDRALFTLSRCGGW